MKITPSTQEARTINRVGQSSEQDFRFRKSVSRFINEAQKEFATGILDANEVYDNGNRVLTEAARQTLEAGFDTTPFDHGTKSSGTLTIDPKDGQYQTVVCNGAFTLAPASTTKYATVVLHITNGSSAGSISFSGMTKKYPSGSLNTINTNKFSVFLYFFGSFGVDYAIQPRQ
jgi:hypothetical protein